MTWRAKARPYIQKLFNVALNYSTGNRGMNGSIAYGNTYQ